MGDLNLNRIVALLHISLDASSIPQSPLTPVLPVTVWTILFVAATTFATMFMSQRPLTQAACGLVIFHTLGKDRVMSLFSPIQWCDSTLDLTTSSNYCDVKYHAVRQADRVMRALDWADLIGSARPHKPWLDGLPRVILLSDGADKFTNRRDFDCICNEIMKNVLSERGPRHQWLWPTNRLDRLRAITLGMLFMGCKSWPDNLWVGANITTQAETNRIADLMKVGDEHTIRFVSIDPQYEPIDLRKWPPRLDWVIQGGESGTRARPFHVEWAEVLLQECRNHDIPYFLRQLGSNAYRDGSRYYTRDVDAADWHEWPRKLRVRNLPILETQPFLTVPQDLLAP